jgi:predicted RNase H-like HicB family nuclease
LVLDLNVLKTDDGYTAEVPTVKGCESWAHGEDEAIEKTVELLKYYMQTPADTKIKIDRARRELPLTVYKIIFDK